MTHWMLSSVALTVSALAGLSWTASRHRLEAEPGSTPVDTHSTHAKAAEQRVGVTSVLDGDTLRVAAPAGAGRGLRADRTQAAKDGDVGERLLFQCVARVLDPRADVQRAQRYRRASNDARRNGRGLWRSCRAGPA